MISIQKQQAEIAIDTSVALYHLVGNSPEDRAFQMQDTLTTQVKDAYNRDVTNGDIQSQFKFFSRGVFEIASAVGGTKGVTQALDATKAAKVAEVVEVTGTVKKAEEVVKTTQGMGEVTSEGLSNVDTMKAVLKSAKRVDDRLEATLEDGTKVIFRKDVGENAHPIGKNYPDPVDHYNIELHKPKGDGRYKQKDNFHIIVDKTGNVTEIIE